MIGLEPRRHGGGEIGRVTHELLDRASLLERDDVVGPNAVARNVDPAAVDLEVAVADELPRLGA